MFPNDTVVPRPFLSKYVVIMTLFIIGSEHLHFDQLNKPLAE